MGFMMKERQVRRHTVIGGGGVRLCAEETGNPAGRPLLFIHGFSQCRLVWAKQTQSPLADEFRLVTVDLRGHGSSEKPRDAYGDSRVWADDVAAVIAALRLDRPVLVGWSYGGIVALDYLRYYGEEAIAGLHLVGARSRIGVPEAAAETGEAYAALRPALFSEAAGESVGALEAFIRLCTYRELAPEDYYLFLGFNAIVPSYVRYGLMNRAVSNDDLLPTLGKPVLLAHGAQDPIVLPRHARHNAALLSGATVSFYEETAHNPFWEQPERFNRELGDFARSL